MSYYGPDPKRAFIENLNDILDVQTDTVLDREILAYDSYNSRWIPRQLELQDLTDVNYVNPVDNDTLIYNSTTGQFEVGQFTTDNISEGSTNLYYTDARVAAYLASSSYATDADVSTAIANLIDSAPGTMDTLNELATALNDDPNFSTTITTLIGTKLNTADFGNSFDVAFSSKTSDNLPEGSVNRYFTNTRFNTAFDTRLATAIQSTDNIAEGQNNLYFSNERVDDRVAALLTAGTNITITYDDANGVLTIDSTDTEDDLSNNTTDDLAEGQTNLYYTDARADARAATVASNQILNTVTKSFVDSLGVNANYLDNLDSTQFIRKDQDVTLTKQITFPSATSVRPVMPAGFLSRSDTLIGTAVIWSPSEQYHPTNGTAADQYGIMFNYTAGNPSLNIPTETKLRFIGGGNDKFVIDLDGTVTYDTYEVATLNDIGTNLDLSNKSTTDLAEGNNLYYTDERVDDRVAALFNAGTNLSATYDDANNTYSINVDNTGGFNLANNTTSDLAEGTNKYYTDSRADARVTAGFSSKSTDQLSEGSTNLYYTEERAQDAAASLFTNGTHTNITVTYDDVNNKINLSATDTEDNLSNNTTNDLAEGSNNLYFTNARADARADARIALVTGANLDLSQRTSDNLPEGTIHRYYRTSRFNTDFSSKTTDDLSEGNANLYFTTERAQDAIGSLINSGTNISITYDDPNNQLVINVDSTGGLDLSNNDTGDLPEGTNLYYTDARVGTYLSAQGYITSADGGNADTVDGIEGSNLRGISSEYTGSVGTAGWYTIAEYGNGRAQGEFHIYDTNSSRHNYVKLDVVWSYGNGGITCTANGKHGILTIQHARLLYNTSDQTYGGCKLQIYCASPSWTLRVRQVPSQFSGWGGFNQTTIAQADSVTGFAEYSRASNLGLNGGLSTSNGSWYAAGHQVLTEEYGSFRKFTTPTTWSATFTAQTDVTINVASQFGVPDTAKAILVTGYYHISGYSQGASGQGDHALSMFKENNSWSGTSPWSFTTSSNTGWGTYVLEHDGDASGSPHNYGAWGYNGIIPVNSNRNIYGRLGWGRSGGTHYNTLWCFGYWI